jgi:7-cyano-7-deazaguanine synthase
MPLSHLSVLCSGGLDSAVLVAHEAQQSIVIPIYVVEGLAWEKAERAVLERLLGSLGSSGRVRPLVTLELPMQDVYPSSHWALAGTPPGYHTPDEDVYLIGRNVTLLTKAAVYSALDGIHRIAIGPLAGNPFPDARPAFLDAMGHALSLGLDSEIRIDAPFLHLHKSDVIRRGAALGVPFELTVSCMNPENTRHCGACSKCRERRDAFGEAGIEDPTDYKRPPD